MQSQYPADQNPNESFGPCFTIQPSSPHTHTAILLHGRGSTGKEFAEEFLASRLTTAQNLPERFSEWRWVFPSSRLIWNTTFEEHMLAWFDDPSLMDIYARQDVQAEGIRVSVEHVRDIIRDEIALLNGKAEMLVLGGISQGAAVGLWTLLSYKRDNGSTIGAFVGASTWLPFANNVEGILSSEEDFVEKEGFVHTKNIADEFVLDMMSGPSKQVNWPCRRFPPVFLGHGTDDAYVDVELGRQAARILDRLGASVEWREYLGAESEGHWFRIPDEMDDIHTFLSKKLVHDHDKPSRLMDSTC